MSILSRIIASKYFKHVVLAMVLSLLLLFLVVRLLNWYTHHNDIVKVPDFAGMSMAELETRAVASDFELQVLDSVFDPEKKKGSIAFQDPPAGSVVKRGRVVFLTLVAILPEQVRMPNLIDLTLRQASAVLETYGLRPGNLDYVPDIAKNAVLRQRHKGAEIAPETWIEKGSRIDLVLGKGGGTEGVSIPFLIGKRRSEAIRAIREAFFNVGREVFEDGRDTLFSRVYKQQPSALGPGYHKAGESIDLWYRSEKKFDFDNYINQYRRDSLGESLGIDSL